VPEAHARIIKDMNLPHLSGPMPPPGRMPRLWLLAVSVLFCLLPHLVAQAGALTKAQVQAQVGESFLVGEKLSALPVWPVFQRNLADGGKPALQAYAFETIDIEPVAGYGGKPINILVVTSPSGKFLDVRLLSHNEPIFQAPARNALLAGFAEQYVGLSIQHQIQVLTPKAKREADDQKATLHGVTAGTVSAMAMDRTIMEAAAQVAYARLDDPNAKRDAGQSRGPDDQYERMGWNLLAYNKLVQPFSRSNREVQAQFNGTPAEGQDAEGRLQPQGQALDLWVMLAGLPHVGRNLFDTPGWVEVRRLRDSGVGVIGVLDSSRYTVVGTQDDTGGRVARLTALQEGRRFELHALPYRHGLRLSGQRSGVGAGAVMRLFVTAPGAGFDLAKPVALEVNVSRANPPPDQPRTEVKWTHNLTLPDLAKWQPVRETPPWWKVWQQRKADLAILVTGLVVLSIALAYQKWLSASQKRLTAYRVVYLGFTLVFVGWAAQGQLTIVNITSLGSALLEGRSGEFLMSDPMAIVLWAFVGVTLLVWGRGTFCGWLCPFGAFQELLSMGAKLIGLKPRQFHRRTDTALKLVKYVALAAIAVAVVAGSPWVDAMVEVEPFKTSISMSFARDWPYVAWAVACLGLSVFVFRGYCRYICPLGAALAVLGRFRLWAWIPRRAECGTPCQTCRHGCGYQAITPVGKIDYTECFQCLDCVTDYQDDQRCLPLIRERKAQGNAPMQVPAKVIPIQPVPRHA
jgi:NosR/NirI family transcriptional regulator, nitrous oxide reductase regulator